MRKSVTVINIRDHMDPLTLFSLDCRKDALFFQRAAERLQVLVDRQYGHPIPQPLAEVAEQQPEQTLPGVLRLIQGGGVFP